MAIKSYTLKGKKLFEVYVNGFDVRGKRFQMRKRAVESITKAKNLEFEFERELAKLKEGELHLRWHEWFTECLSIMKVSYRPSTLYSYEKCCNKWVNPHFANKELRVITKLDIHEVLYEKMQGERVNDHTRKFNLKIIKRIFQMAIDNGKLDRNPCQGMKIKVPETEQKVLTNSEVEKLLYEAKVTNHRFYSIWLVALFTGMRSGELYALRWSDLDFETQAISVSRSWSNKNGYTTTKNQKTRIVPISNDLLVFLKELKLQRGHDEFVLPHLSEWSRGDAASVLRGFCSSIKLTQIRFHDLRATFITNLLARGESLVRVMAIVGHEDMDTTNVYVRKAGIELTGGTEKLGYKVPSGKSAKLLRLV